MRVGIGRVIEIRFVEEGSRCVQRGAEERPRRERRSGEDGRGMILFLPCGVWRQAWAWAWRFSEWNGARAEFCMGLGLWSTHAHVVDWAAL